MSPTIHDVAAKAGVSKSTVSLVLQDSPLVKETTRIAVQKVMAEIGYVYNTAAAGLRGRSLAHAAQSQTAAAPTAVPAAVPLSCDLSDATQAEFAAAVQVVASALGLGLHLLAGDETAPALAFAGRSISTKPEHAGRPNTLFALHPSAPARLEEGMAAQTATRHLLGLSRAQVAFVGGFDSSPRDQLRLQGYLARMKRADSLPLVMMGGRDFGFGRRIAAKILQRFPVCTAALCVNDQVALGMLEALGERGIAVGEAFRVVGWGDTEPAAAAGLSSLQPDMAALAAACVAWVQKGGEVNHLIPLNFIRRASSLGGA